MGHTSKGRGKETKGNGEGKEGGKGMSHLYKRGDKRPWPLVPVTFPTAERQLTLRLGR